MPIKNLTDQVQPRFGMLGKLRKGGEKTPSGFGPALDHWRFTSYGIARLCKLVGLEVVYVHPKGKIGATLTVLWCNLAVRGVNAISKLLHQPTPLRDRMVIRWLLVLPQWAYLWLQNTRIAKSTAIKNIYAELGDFLTPGYFLVARR